MKEIVTSHVASLHRMWKVLAPDWLTKILKITNHNHHPRNMNYNFKIEAGRRSRE